MSTNQTGANPQRLNWRVSDIERKLFFSGGRFTKASHILSALLALACTTIFYGILEIPQARSTYVYEIFTQRGPTQYLTVFFFSWTSVTALSSCDGFSFKNKQKHQSPKCKIHIYDILLKSSDFHFL